jgi:membrane associated rhomboid family serine protease
LNMYSLYIFGQVLEPMLGRGRFAALYLLSLFGGSVGVLWLASPDSWVVGASGAIFGMMAAYFVVLRKLGQNSSQMLGLIAINLVFGFVSSGVSWQGHVGGLVTGGVVALVLANTRQLSQQAAQRLGLVSVAVILVLLTVFRANLLGL